MSIRGKKAGGKMAPTPKKTNWACKINKKMYWSWDISLCNIAKDGMMHDQYTHAQTEKPLCF